MTATMPPRAAAYIVAGLLFILSLAGLSQARDREGRQHVRHRRHGDRAGRDHRPGHPQHLRRRHRAARRRRGHRRRDRPLAGPPGRDDRHARADRDPAQLRRPRRRPGRLERLPLGRGERRRADRGRGQPARHPLRRGGDRRLHRRGHLHRLDRRLPQALRADQVQPADAAGAQPAQPGCAGRLRRPHRGVRDRAEPGAALGRHRDRARAGLAPGGLDRRRRHAGRRLDAQQLLRLGGRGLGLPARQRPADHHRRAGRLLRCLPLLHHVHGDEPVVHLRHRRRVRQRGQRQHRRPRLRRAHRDHRRRRSPSCSATPTRSSSRPATAWPSPRPRARSPS